MNEVNSTEQGPVLGDLFKTDSFDLSLVNVVLGALIGRKVGRAIGVGVGEVAFMATLVGIVAGGAGVAAAHTFGP